MVQQIICCHQEQSTQQRRARRPLQPRRGVVVVILLLLSSSVSSSIPATTTELAARQQLPRAAASSSTRKKTSARALSASAAARMTTNRGGGDGPTTTTTTTSASTTTSSSSSRFVNLRQTLFPIFGTHEVCKFFLIASIKFWIILALTLTRDTKDTLVVTQCGAEAIAFLKIYGVLPAATIFIAGYGALSDFLQNNKRLLFYVTCIPFFCFFVIYDLLIYPNTDLLHPKLETVQAWIGGNGGGMAVLVQICAHWTSAVFYIVAEIYSSVSVGLLFWQFANDVVPVHQAKRFYPLFAQISGLAPIVAGQYVVRFTNNNYRDSMHRLTAMITVAGIMICVFYQASFVFCENEKKMQNNEAAQEEQEEQQIKIKKKKKKPKMTMMESIQFLANSQYLRLIAMLVLGYGLSINFTEIMWKSLVKQQYANNPMEYQRFMAHVSSAVGASTCIVIFFGVQIIRILGWRVGALATPTVMALLAIPFFFCSIIKNDDMTRIAVLFGTLQSIFSKTCKYALFDPTTQMAYIPLDDDSKIKGKAAIDVLGSRIGKSGGSLIQQVLVFWFGGNIVQAAPVVAILYYAVLVLWMAAANQLSGLFLQAQEQEQKTKEE